LQPLASALQRPLLAHSAEQHRADVTLSRDHRHDREQCPRQHCPECPPVCGHVLLQLPLERELARRGVDRGRALVRRGYGKLSHASGRSIGCAKTWKAEQNGYQAAELTEWLPLARGEELVERAPRSRLDLRLLPPGHGFDAIATLVAIERGSTASLVTELDDATSLIVAEVDSVVRALPHIDWAHVPVALG
jgi:hypothetical protein